MDDERVRSAIFRPVGGYKNLPRVFSSDIRMIRSTIESFTSPAVQTYLATNDWKYGDYLLYAAAYQSLDLTIARLGRDRFDGAMKRYLQLKQAEQGQCAPTVEFPCSNTGQPHK